VDLLDLAASNSTTPELISVPPAPASYIVESAKASDYDYLLVAEGGAHDDRGPRARIDGLR